MTTLLYGKTTKAVELSRVELEQSLVLRLDKVKICAR